MGTVGIVLITFVTNVSKEVLENDFNEFLLKRGSISLVNVDYDEIELEIHEHEFTYLD